MAAWAVTAWRLKHPQCRISWATETFCLPVVDHERLATEVIEFRRQSWKSRKGSPAALWEQWQAYAALRRREFDFAADLQGHLKTALAVRMVRARHKISRPGTDALARRLVPQASGPLPTHEVDKSLAILRCFSPDLDMPTRPFLPISENPHQETRPVATITTGASRADKLVPVEVWQQVAVGLTDAGYRVVALGGPGDPALAQPAENLVGKTTLRETLAWLEHCQLHLCGDTGTGHLAAGYGVPTISVFMSESYAPERYAPRGEKVTLIRAFQDGCSAAALLEAAKAQIATK